MSEFDGTDSRKGEIDKFEGYVGLDVFSGLDVENGLIALDKKILSGGSKPIICF